MRSMTNGEYVIGKTWGNLQVFLVLNIVVVILALVFNSLAKGTSIHWQSYGIYLLLISIPTLIYIMGLSFLLMSVIRNQAVTFVIILGYIGITLFLLQAKYYYIFDYMAFNIPMLNSTIVGFGNIDAILVHRGIYFLLGLGFIFLTIFLLKRLPQSESMTIFSIVFSIVFIAAGGFLAWKHINQFRKDENLKIGALTLNNTWVKEKLPVILKNDISLEHKGSEISAISTLRIRNNYKEPLTKLVFSLNNGLNVNSVKINNSEYKFQREMHLLIVPENVELSPGTEANVEISYSGKIDETLCYLDIDEATRLAKYGKFVINVDKRYAFVTPDYVLLTPESNWYPKTGVTYSTTDVRWNRTQFIDFTLNVKTSPGLKPVSQGSLKEIGEGNYSFKSENPITQIALSIGNYKEKNIKIKDIDVSLWHIEGHDFFKNSFPESKDTLNRIIEERFGDFERSFNLQYPFKRLLLVEVPAQFKTYERAWASGQESVQPEMVFLPEKAYSMPQADFEGAKKRMKRWGGGGMMGGGEMTPLDIELRGMSGSFNQSTAPSPYFIFPMLYIFQNNIQSENWPITNRIFEAFLKNQVTDIRSVFMRNMSGENEDELANIALQDSTFEEILSDVRQKRIIDNVIKLKGDVLFSMVQFKAGTDEFKNFIKTVLAEYKFRNITFEEFDTMIKDKFGIELSPMMSDWFNAKTLPGYLISPIKVVKVKSGDMMKTHISLKATNFSDTEGLLKLSFRIGGFGSPGGSRGGFGGGGSNDVIEKLIALAPHQTKDLSYLLDSEPRMVILNTLTSKNIPQTISVFFRDIKEDPKANPVEGETISDVAVQSVLPNETIVDNEDKGFSVTKNETGSLLEKWLLKEQASKSKYSGINWWRTPLSWTATTGSDFYGEYIRSAHYIKNGDGSQKARWSFPVKRPGSYDVFCHIYKSRGFGRGRDHQEEKGEYNFIIHNGNEQQDVSLDIPGAASGWNLLGTFYFSSDSAAIELTNKSTISMIFADAVKIVEQ
jgi:hypothetical protein